MKTLPLAFALALATTSAVADAKITRSSMGGDIDVDRAPDGAVLRTMGGDIRVDESNGEVIARTMGGNIRVRRLNGSLKAGTMGGNVEVEVVGSGSNRTLQITSFGGDVEVDLPKHFSAEFELELERDDDDSSDRIISDFPLQIEETSRRRWLRKVTVLNATGRNGTAANRVKIHTIGGDIYLRAR